MIPESEVIEGNKRFMLPQIVSKSYDASFSTTFDPYAWTVKKFATKLKEMVCSLTGCTMEDLENSVFKSQEIPGWIREKISYSEYGGPPSQEGEHMTYRQLLQELGSTIRHIHPNAWVNGLFSEYQAPLAYQKAKFDLVEEQTRPLDFIPNEEYPQHSRWMVTDMRYPNELDRIKSFGGIVIRISAGGVSLGEAPYFNDSIRNVWTPNGLIEVPAAQADLHESETALDHYKLWDYYVKNTGSLVALYNHAKEIVTKFNLHL